MKRPVCALIAVAVAFFATEHNHTDATADGKPSGPSVVDLNGHRFTLPDGFTIELVAKSPIVARPVAAAFDERGRLYVTDSAGVNDPVGKQLEARPHRVLRLDPAQPDGRVLSGHVFADKVMFPQGVMVRGGACYVAEPPCIRKYTAADDTGTAGQRETWFDGKTLTGCANDLHGPYPGPDGWVYWTKGAFAKQTHRRPDGTAWSSTAAHVFRSRSDGTGLEPVMTGGMDNPVDVAFAPDGERFFSTTFFQHPAGGKRDGLVHAVYGGVYGKDHDPIRDHPRTDPELMPVLAHMGAAAPSGLHRYESTAFGAEYVDNLFCAQFNTAKVTRHVLVPSGSTYTTRDTDFLVSDNRDFHPTDVIEDADGSLIVVDTGGWYKLCCPTSQLAKADVLGAIYRVRKVGGHKLADPRGLKLDWAVGPDELANRLSDERIAVRNRAVDALGAARPDTAVAPVARVLAESAAARVRLAAVWTLCRLDHEDARAAIRKATADPDESVRQAAVHAVSVWRDRAAVAELHGILAKPSPSNRRAAAEALGRIGDPRSVPLLLAALGEKPDRVLRHSLTYALIELGDAEQTAAGLRDKSPDVRRAALIALDQMPGGRLKAETVTAELASTDPETRTVAWWIAGRHPEWGGSLAGYFRDRLAAEVPPADRDALAARLAKFAAHPEVTPVLTARLADGSEATRRLVLRAMTASGAKPAPDAWLLALATVAVDPAAKLEREAVAAARGLALPKTPPAAFRTAMAAVGRNEKLPPEVRFQALAVVPGPVEPAAFDALLGGVRLNQPFAVRSAAAEALVRSSLSGEQLVALAGQLKAVGPMEFDRCLEPFATSADERVGTALVTALADPAVRASLRSETLKARLAKFPAPVHKQAEPLFAALAADSAKQRQRLDDLLAGLKDGDARRGQAVFNSAKAACAACHAIGYQGGRVGPDLTRIGGVRSERDLLEAVVFPSASFVRSYESVRVTTADGRAFNGIVKKDAPDELTLTVSATEEVRIARGDVEEVQPGTVSVMPAGLDQQLTRQELADLIAFLKTCK